MPSNVACTNLHPHANRHHWPNSYPVHYTHPKPDAVSNAFAGKCNFSQ